MDVGASIPSVTTAQDLTWRTVAHAPTWLCTLLRCVEVADQPQGDAVPLPPDAAAARPARDRPLYAVEPIGRILPAARDPVPLPAETVRAVTSYHLTNLGTLLDVLA